MKKPNKARLRLVARKHGRRGLRGRISLRVQSALRHERNERKKGKRGPAWELKRLRRRLGLPRTKGARR